MEALKKELSEAKAALFHSHANQDCSLPVKKANKPVHPEQGVTRVGQAPPPSSPMLSESPIAFPVRPSLLSTLMKLHPHLATGHSTPKMDFAPDSLECLPPSSSASSLRLGGGSSSRTPLPISSLAANGGQLCRAENTKDEDRNYLGDRSVPDAGSTTEQYSMDSLQAENRFLKQKVSALRECERDLKSSASKLHAMERERFKMAGEVERLRLALRQGKGGVADLNVSLQQEVARLTNENLVSDGWCISSHEFEATTSARAWAIITPPTYSSLHPRNLSLFTHRASVTLSR